MTDTTAPSSQPALLTAPRGDGAYELKFLLPDAVAEQLLACARLHLAADPHSDPSLGDAYRVNSVYFDTRGLDVFLRSGVIARQKFRIRRYGLEPRVFLERKSKSRGLVRKRRTLVSDSDLALLANSATSDSNLVANNNQQMSQPSWPGDWFHRRLVLRQLVPQCQVSYDRIARVGMTPDGPTRLTVDRNVRCRTAAGPIVTRVTDGTLLLAGSSIVEFKYRVALPTLFKSLIHEFALNPSTVSKYRLSVTACGLQPSKPVASQLAGAATTSLDSPRTAAACG